MAPDPIIPASGPQYQGNTYNPAKCKCTKNSAGKWIIQKNNGSFFEECLNYQKYNTKKECVAALNGMAECQ
jgi:hypothetical protein